MSNLAPMTRYVEVKMFKVSDSDYYPFLEERDGAKEAWEVFQLNDEGQWIQECIPPLIDNYEDNSYNEEEHKELTAIKGFDGDDGEKLLRFLNEQTKQQQLENGVSESDVFQGTVILNSLGNIMPLRY